MRDQLHAIENEVDRSGDEQGRETQNGKDQLPTGLFVHGVLPGQSRAGLVSFLRPNQAKLPIDFYPVDLGISKLDRAELYG